MRHVVQATAGLLLVIKLPDFKCVRMVRPLQRVSVRSQKLQRQQQPNQKLTKQLPLQHQPQQTKRLRLQRNLKVTGGVESQQLLNLQQVQHLKVLQPMVQVVKGAVRNMVG
ncbi:MAG: hypothetical protein BGO44_07715 [Legionella sp. 39-23]|nr:MAG: hypothetical protein BGO44_07715 [Legionella sp. 39-23]